MPKKILIPILFIVLLCLLMGIFSFLKNKQLHPSPLSQPDSAVPSSTGAEPYTPPPATDAQIAEAKIHEVLPLKQPTFVASFDYKKDKIQVYLKTPYETAHTNFLTWLEQNGYEAIPESRIEYLLD